MNKLLSLVLVLSGLAASASTISVIETWGGAGIQVRVFSDRSASVSFDCASGGVGPSDWIVTKGKLNAVGFYRQETGVRPPRFYRPVIRQAFYVANVNKAKGTMTLNVELSREQVKTFKLKLNAEPVLHRCM